MSDRLKFFKSERGHSPAPPGGPSRPSTLVSSPQNTTFPTENDTTTRRERGGSDGPHIKPPTAVVSAGGGSRDAKQRSSFPHVISRLFSRRPSPDPTHIDQSTSFDPRQSDPSMPGPPSPVLPEEIIDIPDTIPSERIIHGNNESSHQQSGVNLDIPLSTNRTLSSSAVSARERKKTIIATIRHVLQTAASALKLAPIPNLDQIPNILLLWLQVYETIDNNDENLKGLYDEVRNAHETIFRPLQLWTGQAPPEIRELIQQFNLALRQQLRQIEALKRRKLAKKVILATEVSQEISAVKSCISDAVSRFTTAATTLNLFHTIRLSVDYELSKLYKANAEYSAVESKSECLENTRVRIQESILGHLEKQEHRFVWLRGSPGTGKTAISMSVASTLAKRRRLAASFFWDKNQVGTGVDSIKYFPSTLARQLALFNTEYGSLLVNQLRQPSSLEGVPGSALEKQMRAWIVEPMLKLLSLGEERFIVILDGLDECGAQEELESLMKLVLILDELPGAFSVLVSCRPESSVESAWVGARAQGHVIPCEDVDIVTEEERSQTIHRMVEEGLRGCIDKSAWKPSKEDIDAFASACRGLPIIASIRVRDVSVRTRRGATLRSEFEYFRGLTDAPTDVNSEYLRILRRAYMFDSSGVPPHIAEKYHQVVGMIIAAREPLSAFSMSQLLGIAEEEVLAILEPIGSIVNLSSKSGLGSGSENPSKDMKGVKFYHATMKEFIMGDSIGNGNDKVFFIRDANQYFIGLPLLRFFNNSCERDVFGLPVILPLGDKRKWSDFIERKRHLPHHLRYAREYLLEHLDPSQLFAQESNLQNEFNTFLTRNLVTFMHLVPRYEGSQRFPGGFDEFENCDSFKLLREAREKQLVEYPSSSSSDVLSYCFAPWHLHRSTLPFTPSSSPLYKLYGHLSDPVQIFTISGGFSGHRIPLSEDSLNARMVMEAKLPNLPKRDVEIDYDAQFNDLDVHNGIVTCAALSLDGCHVALGFGSGVIELADIDHQRTISRFQLDPPNHPVWIEFVHGSHQLTAEDNEGNVAILSHDMTPVNLGTLPNNPAVTRVSDNGLFIIRVPWNTDNSWYDNMTLISILDNPHMQLLASPPNSDSGNFGLRHHKPVIPHRRTLGFSPGARFIGAFDRLSAFTWSTDSGELIARYRVTDFNFWIMNPAVPLACSHHIPDPVSAHLKKRGAADRHHSKTDVVHHLDESWIKCPFYVLSQGKEEVAWMSDIRSSAAGRTPLFGTDGEHGGLPVFFNGKLEFVIPEEYRPAVYSGAKGLGAWYGDRVPSDPTRLYSPRSSQDGTRILFQGRQTAPIVVDLSQVI